MFSFAFKITSNNKDENLYLKESAILDYAQEVAGLHAELLDVGKNKLRKDNLIRIVIRTKFEVIKEIQDLKEIKIKTNPIKNNLIEYPRDYFVYSDNKLLYKGRSVWVVYDLNNNRPILLNKNIHEDNSISAFNERIKKLEKLNLVNKENYVTDIKILNSYIDSNKHMNNSKVMDIYFDYLMDKNKRKLLKEFQIEYIASAYLNDILSLYKYKVDETNEYLYAYKDNSLIFYLNVKYNKE